MRQYRGNVFPLSVRGTRMSIQFTGCSGMRGKGWIGPLIIIAREVAHVYET